MKSLTVSKEGFNVGLKYSKDGKELKTDLTEQPSVIERAKNAGYLDIIPEGPQDWKTLAQKFGNETKDKDGKVIASEDEVDFVNRALQYFCEYGGGIRTNIRNWIASEVEGNEKQIEKSAKALVAVGMFSTVQEATQFVVSQLQARSQSASA